MHDARVLVAVADALKEILKCNIDDTARKRTEEALKEAGF